MSATESAANVLLVEGVDDKHVVWHLCSKLAPDLEFDCLEKGSYGQLLRAIPVEMKVPGREAVGILMDADDDISARWEAIHYRVNDTSNTFPNALLPSGTILTGKPRVGIWLMPDNQNAGELEDFVLQLLPADDPVWPRAERFVEGIPEMHREFRPQKVRRAKIHAWLATRQKPRQMGAAIGAGSLNATAPAAKALVDWLTALFGPVGPP